MNQKTLTKRSIKGLFWSFAGFGGHGLIQAVVVLVLARLLTPDAFGVVSASMIVIGFSEIFSTVGIGPALIQRPKLNNRHIKTGLSTSLFLGVFFLAIVITFASDISAFFEMEGLTHVLIVLSILFPLNGYSIIYESIFQRKMRFKLLAKVKIISYSIGYGVIGISLAYLDYGVWSLVTAQISQTLIKLIFYLIKSDVLYDLSFYREEFVDLFNFGSGFSIATVGNFGASQGDFFVVAKILGAHSLGIYTIAYKLLVFPARLFGTVVHKVLFPAFSEIQTNIPKLRKLFIRATSILAMITIPLSSLLFVLTPEIIEITLGGDWVELIDVFQIFTIVIFFRTGYKISDTVADSVGAVYNRAWRQWIYAGLIIILSYVGGRYYGLYGVAAGVSVSITTNYLLMNLLSFKILKIRLKDLLKVFIAPLLISGLYIVTLYILQENFYIQYDVYFYVIIKILLFLIIFIPYIVLNENYNWIKIKIKNHIKS